MTKKLLRNFAFLFGVLIAGLAIFAHQLGMDNDPGWGTSRIILLLLGLFALLTAAFFRHIETLANFLKQRSLLVLEHSPIRQWINDNRILALGVKLFSMYSFLIPVILIVLTVYTGISINAARNTTRLRTTYYPMQARAFQELKFHLPMEPSEKLLALSNPYDPSQRIGVGEPIDVTLYKGRFYLYWDPAEFLMFAVFLYVLGSWSRKYNTDLDYENRIRIWMIVEIVFFIVFTPLAYLMTRGFLTIFGAVYLFSLIMVFLVTIRMRKTIDAAAEGVSSLHGSLK